MKLIPPTVDAVSASPCSFVDYFRVRLDPQKSADTDMVIGFDFGSGKISGLHIRRAVAEFVPNPIFSNRPADIQLSLSPQAWAALYLGQTKAESLFKAGELKIDGDRASCYKLFDMFDKVVSDDNCLIPPLKST